MSNMWMMSATKRTVLWGDINKDFALMHTSLPLHKKVRGNCYSAVMFTKLFATLNPAFDSSCPCSFISELHHINIAHLAACHGILSLLFHTLKCEFRMRQPSGEVALIRPFFFFFREWCSAAFCTPYKTTVKTNVNTIFNHLNKPVKFGQKLLAIMCFHIFMFATLECQMEILNTEPLHLIDHEQCRNEYVWNRPQNASRFPKTY